MKEVTIDGHTAEFRTSSNTVDPWTLDYCKEKNIPLMAGQAFTDFLLLDNRDIYRIDRYYTEDELKMFTTWEQFQNWISSKCKLIKTIDQIAPMYERKRST